MGMPDSLLFYGLLTCLLIQTSYWCWFFLAFRRIKTREDDSVIEVFPVSVLVCYKDESNHIGKTLQAILSQDYGAFEVIAMDDESRDGSWDIVNNVKHPLLRSLQVSGSAPGKRKALSEAILAAKYQHCLLTDADCLPASSHWIRSMAEAYAVQKSTQIVLGFGPTRTEKGLLNTFERYETALTAMQYFSYAHTGMPYMGVGRNLMYDRTLFIDQGGFDQLPNTISGDDDLFINQVATSKNVAVNLDPASFVFSAGKSTLFEFLHQKARHISTAPHYKPVHQFLLTVFAVVQVCFYGILCFAFVADNLPWWYAGSTLLLKWMVQMSLQASCFSKLKQAGLNRIFPLLDISMVLYYCILPLFSLISDRKWK